MLTRSFRWFVKENNLKALFFTATQSEKNSGIMAGMGHQRHLAKGSKVPPPPEKDVLRVYSMKFCPYAQRLKLVLAAKGIKHENINVNLKQKPEWYFEKNPRGLVPTIEFNGNIIYESDITSEYVDTVYPGRKLMTQDPLKKAKEQILIGDHGKFISGFYRALQSKNDEEKAAAFEKITDSLTILDKYLGDAKTKFVGGDQPGYADYMIWPHLERGYVYISDVFSPFGNVQKYIENMLKDGAVVSCQLPKELHMQFAEDYKKGDPQYDIGEVIEYSSKM